MIAFVMLLVTGSAALMVGARQTDPTAKAIWRRLLPAKIISRRVAFDRAAAPKLLPDTACPRVGLGALLAGFVARK